MHSFLLTILPFDAVWAARILLTNISHFQLDWQPKNCSPPRPINSAIGSSQPMWQFRWCVTQSSSKQEHVNDISVHQRYSCPTIKGHYSGKVNAFWPPAAKRCNYTFWKIKHCKNLSFTLLTTKTYSGSKLTLNLQPFSSPL